MRITKHEHACLVLEKSASRLVIDPGSFTTPLLGLDDVAAVVVTHEHHDHWTSEQLERILDRSPKALLFGPAGVAAAAAEFPFTTVADGDTVQAGPFSLSFFGAQHAVIHASIPVIDNVGVMVDGLLYYPGDSFTVPSVPVDTLVVPAGAPWLKIGEVIDFITDVAPKRSLPAHEMLLSQIGKNLANDRIRAATETAGGEFFLLQPGETLDL